MLNNIHRGKNNFRIFFFENTDEGKVRQYPVEGIYGMLFAMVLEKVADLFQHALFDLLILYDMDMHSDIIPPYSLKATKLCWKL
jgi:hypothetical protein